MRGLHSLSFNCYITIEKEEKPLATDNVVLRRPRFDLRFVTEETEYHIKYDTKTPDNNFMTESVISMTTKNALEDDISAFSFVLSGDMEWDKLLNENDMVILSIEPNEYNPGSPFGKDEVKNNTVVMGLISEVRIEGTYGDDSKMYRITGQSFQKAFANFELRTIQQAGHATGSEYGWMDYEEGDGTGFTRQLTGKTVSGTVRQLVDRFKQYMNYNFVGDDQELQDFDDFFRYQLVYAFDTWEEDENLLDPLPITSYEGSLNQLIKEVAAPPFIEYFFDVYPAIEGYERVWMTVRRTPFDYEDWTALDTYLVRTRDVVSDNFGRNDLDAYSIYNLVPEMDNEDQALSNAVPWYNPALVDKYGYKMLEASSKFFNFATELENEENDDLEGEEFYENSVAAKYGRKLYYWYANNPNFYAGDITVVGHPDYRIGNRLVYQNYEKDETWEFYIESVEHSYTYTEGYQTKIGVTRGLRVEDENDHGIRFSPPMGGPERFKGGYLDEMSLSTLEEIEEAREAELSGGSGNQVVVGGGGVVNPAEGSITSPYGMRTHPKHGDRRMHWGIDVAGGGTDIRAMSGGVVTTSRHHPSYGNYVEINHGSMNNQQNVSTLYAHLASRDVNVSDTISPGQKIGTMGTTGTSTGVHLHFEVKINGENVDPEGWVSY